MVRGADLRQGKTKSCGCLRIERRYLPEGEASFNAFFRHAKQGAQSRGLRWALTKEQVRKLTKKNCAYCRVAPKQFVHDEWFNGKYLYNGLDRVDNAKGYTLDNIVPCCKWCNIAKGTRTAVELRQWITKVYHNWVLHEGNEVSRSYKQSIDNLAMKGEPF